MKRIQNKRGLTLAEVVIAASISVVISGIMLSFFIRGLDLWQVITNQSDLRSIAQNAMNYMAQELRMATRTSSKNPSPNLTVPSKPNNNSIDFYLPVDLDKNGFIINATGVTEWDTSNIQYQYVPGQKQLQRSGKGSFYNISNNVTLVEFEDNSINSALYNNELKIILALERKTSQNRTVSVNLTSIVKLRN
ncbi:MAG: hypothetical protein QMD94_02010 [Candidatus Omnitrophota bacterium]|nr:hypothetical protein [Candidatus Omnitrophota bacterium]